MLWKTFCFYVSFFVSNCSFFFFFFLCFFFVLSIYLSFFSISLYFISDSHTDVLQSTSIIQLLIFKEKLSPLPGFEPVILPAPSQYANQLSYPGLDFFLYVGSFFLSTCLLFLSIFLFLSFFFFFLYVYSFFFLRRVYPIIPST